MLGFGRASVLCACPFCIVEEMFRPQRVILIWFRDCSALFLVMQQSFVVAAQTPILRKSSIKVLGVQYPFALAPVQFERLLHKPSFSIVGRIDMCSMLRALLLRLNGLLDERWVLSTQYFRMVHIGNNSSWLP